MYSLYLAVTFQLLWILCAVADTQEDLCGIVAATDIGSIYGDWSCDAGGQTTTNPCYPSVWNGTTCQNITGSWEVTEISLNGLGMSETIPTSIQSFNSFLTLLTFSNNALDTSIPSSVGALTALEVVDFSYNSLTGSIPTAIVRCQH